MATPTSRLSWAIGFDHAGFPLAKHLAKYLRGDGQDVSLFGPADATSPVDYAPFCIEASHSVADGSADFGIVIGGSGQGEQIAANKVFGIRAALCPSPEWALLVRRDNDANVLALGSRIIAPEFAESILRVWISTEFAGGRHERRIGLIHDYERDESRLPTFRTRTTGGQS